MTEPTPSTDAGSIVTCASVIVSFITSTTLYSGSVLLAPLSWNGTRSVKGNLTRLRVIVAVDNPAFLQKLVSLIATDFNVVAYRWRRHGRQERCPLFSKCVFKRSDGGSEISPSLQVPRVARSGMNDTYSPYVVLPPT
jgi:hypothetical protein